jgi:hypothetical protein
MESIQRADPFHDHASLSNNSASPPKNIRHVFYEDGKQSIVILKSTGTE